MTLDLSGQCNKQCHILSLDGFHLASDIVFFSKSTYPLVYFGTDDITCDRASIRGIGESISNNKFK
jgi:hypothetical protein